MTFSRFERLAAGLTARGCEAAILVGPDHAIHIAGYQRYLSGLVAVVVDGSGRRTLVVPRYEVDAAEATSSADAVIGYGSRDFLDFDPLPKLAACCLDIVAGDRVGLAGSTEAFSDAAREVVPIADVMQDLRRIKDEDELSAIAESYAVVLEAQTAVEELAPQGASEIELCSAAFSRAQDAAGAPIELISVLASGPNTGAVAAPMHVAGRRRVKAGEAVLSDLAVRVRGYWADTTRTPLAGPNAEVETIRAEITAISHELGASLRPGIRASAVFATAQATIADRFPDAEFKHHAGHGIGIEVGEDPQLVPSESLPLEEGMVLAVEPGVYFPGRLGVRVEDVYVVTQAGGVRIDLR